MNRNLVAFSLLVILAGLAFGLYLISFFGFLILIPALASGSRLPTRPPPTQPKQQPRRIIPPAPPQPESTVPAVQAKPMAAAQPTMQVQSYSPALFPSSMFPSLAGMGSTPLAAKEAATPKPDGRDELVEVGTMLALLKLVFG